MESHLLANTGASGHEGQGPVLAVLASPLWGFVSTSRGSPVCREVMPVARGYSASKWYGRNVTPGHPVPSGVLSQRQSGSHALCDRG